ncbi:uncharacterized protein M6B38_367150 [Iris pallida]|uniref:Uncharacterized protein n=1 Tax=Iris pallida TaxID=29817 RepID=A0AAX6GH64_IRIPA|nr:uncharacterized protein M6B38_367150 [Iris pallida]
MNEWMDGWAKWDVLYRDFNSWEVDLELILLSNDIAWESYGSRAEEEEEGPPLPFANKKTRAPPKYKEESLSAAEANEAHGLSRWSVISSNT